MKENLYLAPEVEMNLSKYYKSSESFQPESLVKHPDHDRENWQRTLVTKPPSNQSDLTAGTPPILSEQSLDGKSPQQPQVEGNRDLLADPQKVGVSAKKRSDRQEVTDQDPVTGFDPAQFMEKIIAEEKIAKAYRRGMQEGLEKAEEDFGDALRALLISCRQLDTIRETLISNSKDELTDFALAIAERIVRISIRDQDETIVATIDEALQRAIKSEEFSIHLHPADYQTVHNKSGELIAGVSGLNNIVIKQDSAIERGGARIESDNCTIDCTLASQFEIIREELKKR